jgi:RimJ/RimL family protein N-acetyltransferase
LEDTKKWILSLKIPYYIVKENENYIGYFRISNLSDTNKNVYIGMDLDKIYRGKGLAFDSYTKFIPFLFDLYSLNKISLEVLSTNKIAYNLYVKLGFVVDGVRRQEVYKNGKYVDSIIMSILKSEMLENKTYTK